MDATGGWVLLAVLATGLLALAGLALIVLLTERPRSTPAEPWRLRDEAEALADRAAALRASAGRAAAGADRARAAVRAAEFDRDRAWSAREAAERAYRVLCAEPEVDPPGTATAVSQAALSAYRRGDLSLPELRALLARAGEHDPARRDRAEAVEAGRRRWVEACREYDLTVARWRHAQQAAHVAEVAAEALADEAAFAMAESHAALLAYERNRPRVARPTGRRGAGRAGQIARIIPE